MLTAGQTIASKYRVLGPLGQGGMGEVVLAEHLVTGRRVAVKVILGAADEASTARFDRETRAMASIDSPHIVGVLDAGVDEATGRRFLAMEYLRGRDLATALARLGPMSSSLVARIGRQACAGLERAHAAGVVHRDVKAANLFLAEQAGDLLVKLLDFGVAKAAIDAAASHALTRTGHLVGSPLYMSPEQAAGDVALDGRSDLFSLGIVLFELVTGAAPHAGISSFAKLLMAVSHTPAPPLTDVAPGVDPRLAAVIARALELDRERRWPSALEMGAALAEIADGRLHAHELGVTLEDATPPRVTVPPISGFATTEVATASTTAASVRRPSAPPTAARPPRWPLIAGVLAVGGATAWSLLHVGRGDDASLRGAASASTVVAASATSAPSPTHFAPSAATADMSASSAPSTTARAAPPSTRRVAPRASAAPVPTASAAPAVTSTATRTRVDATSGFD